MKKHFYNNVVIITGAASGIGYQLALQLAQQGAWLSLADCDSENLSRITDLCNKKSGKAILLPLDISNVSQCKQLIEHTVTEYGRINTLINNAGITMWSKFDQIQDLTLVERMTHVNYLGSVYCTYYALPYLKATQGRIGAITSVFGKMGAPTRTVYAGSKHAMVGFFDSLRIELIPERVSVTVIYPDLVATNIRKQTHATAGKSLGEKIVHPNAIMSSETCASLIIRALAQRQRDVMMSFRGQMALWARLAIPSLVDRMIQRVIEQVQLSRV